MVVGTFPGFEAAPPPCCLAAVAAVADGREKKKKKEDKGGGGTRNLLSLPGDNKDNNGWGDGNNKGAMAEPILRVSHDQSCFAPGSTTILTLVDRPLLDANCNGCRGGNELTNIDMDHLAQTNDNLSRKRREESASGRAGGYAGYVSEASNDDQSLNRMFWTTNSRGLPASAALSRTQRECTGIII